MPLSHYPTSPPQPPPKKKLKKQQHLYEKFLAHDTLHHYHRALAKNDIVAYGPFEESTSREVEEESGEGSAAGGGGRRSSQPDAAVAGRQRNPALPFFRRKASVLIPLAAPRPLQIAVGTSVIKLRLRQSVAVLRRAEVVAAGGYDGAEKKSAGVGIGDDDASSFSPLAPLDAIEFRSAPRLWIPDAKDLPLGLIRLVATYEEASAVEGDGAGGGGSASSSSASASVSASASAQSQAPRQRRVRMVVTATADFRPEVKKRREEKRRRRKRDFGRDSKEKKREKREKN